MLVRWELGAADVNLVVCEWGFVGSLLFGYLVTLLSGATGVLLPLWDAEEALRLVEQHRCTYVLYMPTHGADILRAGRESDRDGSSVRVLVAPGLTRERRVAMHEVFGRAPIADYGLSEVPGHVMHGLAEPWEKVITTEGTPFRGHRRADPRRPREPTARRPARRCGGQRPEPVPGLPRQRRPDARIADRMGWLQDRGPRLPRRAWPSGVRAAAARTSSGAAV